MTGETKGGFDALLGELEQMGKAMNDGAWGADQPKPVDGKPAKKKGCAKCDGKGCAECDPDWKPEDDGAGSGDDPMVGKSFMIQLADGTEVEATDGTELVKSLLMRVDANEEVTVKALGQALDLLKSQGTLIKSLSDQVQALAGTGRGRRTVLTIAEKPGATAETLTKSEPGQMTGQEFLAKAMEAFEAKRITGIDVSRIEAHLNRGLTVPNDIVARVLTK